MKPLIRILILLFCPLLVILLIGDWYKAMYDRILFYFNGTYAEYNQWFPRFGAWLYGVQWCIKIVFFALVVLVIRKLVKIVRSSIQMNAVEDESFEPRKFIWRELLLFSGFLTFYLILYFSFRGRGHETQLVISQSFLWYLIIHIAWNLVVHFHKFVFYLRNYLLEPQLPYNISILRIVFFVYLACIYLTKFISAIPTVSLSRKVALPYIGWLVDWMPVSPDLYKIITVSGIICCLFIAAGFKTRWFLLLNSVCVFYIIAAPNFFGKLWHEQITIWISWIFAFSRCYDVFSIDAMLKKAPLQVSGDYTFPVRFIWIQLGIIYFWSGFYKLWFSGFDWALSKSMVNQLQLEWLEHYDQIPAVRMDHFPALVNVGGLLVILFELSYIFLVLHKRWRWMAAAGGIVMHNLAGYFMYIAFYYLQFIYVFYLDFNVFFRKRVKQALPSRGFSRQAMYAGLTVLGMNFLFGMFNISSYPFSAYPAHSDLVPDRVSMLEFRCAEMKRSVHETGRLNHFRWESYTRMERKMIEDYREGKDIGQALANYWEIWVAHNPELRQCKEVDVYIQERLVAPEGKNQVKTLGKICSIKPK